MLISRIDAIKAKKGSDEGFTLIELSIVLVIIGLIVGGILTGQDLIKAAEQRATLAQIEKYNTAVNTFRNKFGGIPGDLASATASGFGFLVPTTGSVAGTMGYGDGNGLIDGGGSTATTPVSVFLGEPVLFWDQISSAGLIDGSFGGGNTAGTTAGTITTAGAIGAATTSVATADAYMPPAKLARSNSITVAEVSGINYFIMSGITAISTAGVYSSGANYLTPLESYNMDKKVDDGLPLTGSVVTLDGTAALGTVANLAPGGIAACQASSAYVVGTGGGTPQCSLRFRFN